jgi:hypothetical protein
VPTQIEAGSWGPAMRVLPGSLAHLRLCCSCQIWLSIGFQIPLDGALSGIVILMYCHPDVTWCLSKGILSSPLLLTEVEKNNACNKALIEHYPDTCVMRDVFDLLKRYPKSQTWKAHKLCLTDCFQCCNHAEQFLCQHSKFDDISNLYLLYIFSLLWWLPVWCQRCYTIISVHSKVPFGLGGWCGRNTGGLVHIPQQESWPDMLKMFTCNFLI